MTESTQEKLMDAIIFCFLENKKSIGNEARKCLVNCGKGRQSNCHAGQFTKSDNRARRPAGRPASQAKISPALNMKSLLTILLAALLLIGRDGHAQGFVNLDFEDATIAPTPVDGWTYPADPTQCFPGWTVGGSGTVVMYNDLSIGAPAVSLMGPDFPNAANYTPLQGTYSVLLQNFNIDGGPPTLSQTGLIPSGTQTIDFLVGIAQSDAVVTLNGLNIPLVQIAGGRLAGNISAFAGSSAQLTFSTTTGNQFGEVLYFDDIQFSTSSVPEPGAFALAALGGLLAGLHRKRESQQP